MNIGIDLDGVIYDTETLFAVEACFYSEKIGKKNIVDREELKAEKRHGWTIEEKRVFARDYMLDIERRAPILYKARTVLDMLVKRGHKIFIITSRGSLSSEEIDITKQRLAEDQIQFEKLIFTKEDKGKACRENNIHVMVDDYYDYALNVANAGIKCLHMRTVLLKTVKHPNVVEVRNWAEIYREIKKLEEVFKL